ncbi:MAG: glycosyltransferase family 4 protein [Candidatus Woesebacteria bacterium]|nr:glycosyltransferase family 4 protein [Candidatus Woesebacteria bacterium]
MGKAAIFNPYLDTLGGGERYTIFFAKVLAEEGYVVDIEWKDNSIKEKIQNRFGIKLSENINFVDDIKRGENYDVCFWISDGSIPTLRARTNFLHFQVPFKDVNGKTLLNKMKLFRINKIICNSNFTKKVIDKEYGVNSLVIYPPVDILSIKPKRKENTISYVGRFSSLVQSKGHEILIDVFKNLIKEKGFVDWKLILAGGIEVGVGNYLNRLKILSKNINIEFVESPNFNELKEIYGKSKFFWSAAGFGVNEINSPEKVEHFGISLIESMAAGCVPVVYNAGGYKEIITSGENGFLWQNKKDLIRFTEKVTKTSGLYKKVSTQAKKTSLKYSYEFFKNNVCQILK